MNKPLKLLFVCSYNKSRSSTAEEIINSEWIHHARSADTEKVAKVKLDNNLLEWADIVFVMEEDHAEYIRTIFKNQSERKRIIVLDITDNYYFMEPRPHRSN